MSDDPFAGETLTVQVQGGDGEPDRVFVLSRPERAGSGSATVRVREFDTSAGATLPTEYTASTDELRDRFDAALRARRRMSEESYAIRLWLDGRA
jgi:hypothetical protein